MRLLAGLAAGVWCYLAVGVAFGVRPTPLPAAGGVRRPSERWGEWLRQAGTGAAPAQFVAASAGGAAAAALAVLAVTGVAALAVAAGTAAALGPRAH
jgi:hypothetical protein